MNHVSLTGITVTPMTLGTAQLGLEYGVANRSGKPDRKSSFRMLQSALDLGVHCFDTAGLYGDSERILGDFFTGGAGPVPIKPLIVSKFKFSDDRNLTRQELQRHVNDKVEHTLSELQLNRLPVLLLHQPDAFADRAELVTDVLKQLKRDGLVESIGVSLDANSDEQYNKYWPIIRDELYEALQIPLNVLDHRLIGNGALRSMQEAGKVVFARSVFLQGLFFLSDEELPAAIKSEATQPLRMIRELAEREGISLAQLAVSYVRDMPEIASLVIGAETKKQLQDNARLMSGPSIGERTRAELPKLLNGVPSRLLMPAMWK